MARANEEERPCPCTVQLPAPGHCRSAFGESDFLLMGTTPPFFPSLASIGISVQHLMDTVVATIYNGRGIPPTFCEHHGGHEAAMVAFPARGARAIRAVSSSPEGTVMCRAVRLRTGGSCCVQPHRQQRSTYRRK